jgi:hypothetical protein
MYEQCNNFLNELADSEVKPFKIDNYTEIGFNKTHSFKFWIRRTDKNGHRLLTLHSLLQDYDSYEEFKFKIEEILLGRI